MRLRYKRNFSKKNGQDICMEKIGINNKDCNRKHRLRLRLEDCVVRDVGTMEL